MTERGSNSSREAPCGWGSALIIHNEVLVLMPHHPCGFLVPLPILSSHMVPGPEVSAGEIFIQCMLEGLSCLGTGNRVGVFFSVPSRASGGPFLGLKVTAKKEKLLK